MSEHDQDRKKPEWLQAAVFKDEEMPIQVIVRRLQVKKPVFSYSVHYILDNGVTTPHIRPMHNGMSLADAIARQVAAAESYCQQIKDEDAAAFKASRERSESRGREDHRPNNDPKEIAKRKRHQDNPNRRRDEDRARAHR